MKKLTRLLITVLAGALLAACGGAAQPQSEGLVGQAQLVSPAPLRANMQPAGGQTLRSEMVPVTP